jgi:hypothetical protein
MDSTEVAIEFSSLIVGMSKGQYLLVCAMIDAVGGELRLDPDDFARRALEHPPTLLIDGTSGSVVIRLS